MTFRGLEYKYLSSVFSIIKKQINETASEVMSFSSGHNMDMNSVLTCHLLVLLSQENYLSPGLSLYINKVRQ